MSDNSEKKLPNAGKKKNSDSQTSNKSDGKSITETIKNKTKDLHESKSQGQMNKKTEKSDEAELKKEKPPVEKENEKSTLDKDNNETQEKSVAVKSSITRKAPVNKTAPKKQEGDMGAIGASTDDQLETRAEPKEISKKATAKKSSKDETKKAEIKEKEQNTSSKSNRNIDLEMLGIFNSLLSAILDISKSLKSSKSTAEQETLDSSDITITNQVDMDKNHGAVENNVQKSEEMQKNSDKESDVNLNSKKNDDTTEESDSTLWDSFIVRVKEFNEVLKAFSIIIPVVVLALSVAKMYTYSNFFGIPLEELDGLTVVSSVTVNLLVLGSLAIFSVYYFWYINPKNTRKASNNGTDNDGTTNSLKSSIPLSVKLNDGIAFFGLTLFETFVIGAYLFYQGGILSNLNSTIIENILIILFVIMSISFIITSIISRIDYLELKNDIKTRICRCSSVLVLLFLLVICICNFYHRTLFSIGVNQKNRVQEIFNIDDQTYITVCENSSRKLVVKCDEYEENNTRLVIYRNNYRYIDPKDYTFELKTYRTFRNDGIWYQPIKEDEGSHKVTAAFTIGFNGKYCDTTGNYFVEIKNNDEVPVNIGNYYNIEIQTYEKWRYYSSSEAKKTVGNPFELKSGTSEVCLYNLNSFGKLVPGHYRIACGDDGSGTNYYYVEFDVNNKGEIVLPQ